MQIFQIWAPTVLVNAAASASGIVGDDRCYEAWTGAVSALT